MTTKETPSQGMRFTDYQWPEDISIAKDLPDDAELVAKLYWSWSPMHNRKDRYYLSSDEHDQHWVLWTGAEDSWYNWKFMPFVVVSKAQISSQYDAAFETLKFGWTKEAENNVTKMFHEIEAEGILTEADLIDIAESIWPNEPG